VIGQLSIAQTSEAVATKAPPVPQVGASPDTEQAPSAFAQLIQQITHEPAPRTPAASSKPPLPQKQQPQLQQPTPLAPRSLPATVSSTATLQTDDSNETVATAAESSPEPLTVNESSPRLPKAAGSLGAPLLQPPYGTELPAKLKEEAEPIATLSPGRREQKAGTVKATEKSTPASIIVAAQMQPPAPIKLKLPTFSTHAGEEANEQPGLETAVRHVPPPKQDPTQELRPPPALELTIRAQDQPPAEARDQSSVAPEQSRQQSASATAESTVETAQVQQSYAEQAQITQTAIPSGQSAMEPVAPPVAPPQPTVNAPQATITPQAPSANMMPGPKPEQRPAPAMHLEEPLLDEPKQAAQPLRSISIEFSPDGAQDVRLRLAERAGDVHISLHSADPALAGRLSDGVHDLVGTLANAGYDAQAWTPDQGRQNQRQQEAPRGKRGNANGQGTEDFGVLLDQPIKEIS
jgi:hypothetical protein